ncbi:uncharacterized protein V1518DRAFT_410257 [Limtongia smithiae]|uniref:uncharacterized protein n=1 Tax=Limtongia smithiae TaxID=1125753 RepID=UPI0034CEF6D3
MTRQASRRTFKPFRALVNLLRMRSQDIILEYYDVSVYKADFDNLRRDEWFNDNNLTFWYEYLEHCEVLPAVPRTEDIVLLRPSMVFLLAQTPHPRDLRDVLPDLAHAKYIFLPINNNKDVDFAEGGSHWSLLVIDMPHRAGYYYDTLDDCNIHNGERVAHKLAELVGILRFELYSVLTPQQSNGSDCGVMVCMITSALLAKLVRSSAFVTNASDVAATPAPPDMTWTLSDCTVDPVYGRQLISYTIVDLISKYGRKIAETSVAPPKELPPPANASASDNSIATDHGHHFLLHIRKHAP